RQLLRAARMPRPAAAAAQDREKDRQTEGNLPDGRDGQAVPATRPEVPGGAAVPQSTRTTVDAECRPLPIPPTARVIPRVQGDRRLLLSPRVRDRSVGE